MDQKKKNLTTLLGVIFTVIGVIWAVPSFLTEKYLFGAIASVLVIIGLVLLAIAFSE
ncbi:MAG: hypothetical protein PHV16_01055 [Candidatus Nanoarchaeia archaeon]|nr:hypothetical protein [Candidatus Nanoarchaeia archaeon]